MMKVDKNRDKGNSNFYSEHEIMYDVEQNIEISLVDVSDDGIGIKTKEPMKKDRTVSFDICFTRTFYRVVAKVLWTKKSDGLYESGLEIEYMPDELYNEIEDYVSGFKTALVVN